MASQRLLKAKICLVGEGAVGKTSLLRRYAHDEFDKAYLATIAAKVTRHNADVSVPPEGTRVTVDMAIWDVMGHKRFRELLDDAYFTGASGILAVADLTRKETLLALPEWIERVDKVSAKGPIVIAVNKADLKDQAQVTEADIAPVATALGGTYLMTSAMTGEGVEDAFRLLATRVAERALAHRRA